jgi:hypothetical protein
MTPKLCALCSAGGGAVVANNNNNNNNAAVGKLLADLAVVPPAAFTSESRHNLHKASAQAKCPSVYQAIAVSATESLDWVLSY